MLTPAKYRGARLVFSRIIRGGSILCEYLGKEPIKNIQNSSNSNTYKILPDLEVLNLKGKVQGLDEFPLNLLEPLYTVNLSAILFLILIIYVSIALTLKDIDLSKYLPAWLYGDRNIISKLIKYLINRNIKIWYDSRKFILILSWFVLFFALVLNLFTIYIILNSH